METEHPSGLITVHEDAQEALSDSVFAEYVPESEAVAAALADDGEDEYDMLADLVTQNKERFETLQRKYNVAIDPMMLLYARISILADMMLTEDGVREFQLRCEHLVANMLDQIEEEAPAQAARDKLTAPPMNRAQRRAAARH